MQLLSLDISTKSTGWSIFKNSKLYRSGVIKISDKLALHKRMIIFRTELIKLLNKYKINIALVEDVWAGANISTTKILSKFSGIAEELIAEYDIDVHIIETTRVKSFFKCKSKEEVFNLIVDILESNYKYSFKEDNDVIDSIAQAIFYIDLISKTKIRKEKKYGYFYDWR